MNGPLAGSCPRPSMRRRKSTLQITHRAFFTHRYQTSATRPASQRPRPAPCGIATSLLTHPPLDELYDASDDLVRWDPRRVDDDRVRSDAQRRVVARAIPVVALLLCLPHRFQVPGGASGLHLFEPAAGTLVQRRIQEYLDLRVGKHHRSDVPPLHPDPPFDPQAALDPHQCLAHPTVDAED